MRRAFNSLRKYRFLIATSAIIASLPATAHAQAADSNNESADEIVVSARKQNETALDVPIAVSAFSEKALQDRMATNMVDVAEFTPGFQMQQSFGRGFDRPIMRGASNINQAEGKVGIFLNGVPYLGDFSSLDLAAVEQVEVIKGPQSAVFGRGTLSGAINVILKRPSDELEGKVTATLGNYGRREFSGFVSLPVMEGVGIQFGAKSYDIDGQFKNTAVKGERLGDQNTLQLTAGLFLDPTSDISASVRWMHQRDNDGMYAIALQPASMNNCYLSTRPYYCGTATLPDSYGINSNKLQRPGIYRNADRFIGDVNWDIAGSGYKLSFQTGYSDLKEIVGTDQTYDAREFYILSSAAVCAYIPLSNQLCSQSAFNTTDGSRRKTQTYELRLSSPGTGNLRWRVGAFVSHDRKRALTEWLEATEIGPDILPDTVTINNRALFGGLDYDIVHNVTLGLELRHQIDEVTNTTPSYRVGDVFSSAYLATLAYPDPDEIVGVAGKRKATFKATLPRITLNWRAARDLSFYAQFSQGNTPGGFNQIDAPETTYAEEKLTNYEVGLKTNRWGFSYLNLSMFWQNYRNQVLTNTYVTPTTLNSYNANIGRTRIRGIELEGALPIIKRALRLQFNYTFLDAEVRRGIEADQALITMGTACKTGTKTNLDLPGCRDAASIAGNVPPLVSKHTGSVGLRSELPLTDTINVFGGVDVIYRSKMYDVLNLIDTGNSTRVNLQAGFETDSGLRVMFYARNLFNDDTPVGILRYIDLGPGVRRAPTGDSSRAFAITPSRKAEYGLTLTQSF